MSEFILGESSGAEEYSTPDLVLNPLQQVEYRDTGEVSSFRSFTPPWRDVPKSGLVIAVIPAYNEELAIGTVVLLTNQYVSKTIVVDDGSTDRTAEVAEFAGAEVIRLIENSGKAHAMMVGFKKARSYQPAAVVMLDSDGQHNPNEIPAIVAPVLDEGVDLVIGSRFLTVTNKIPIYRQLGQKTLDFLTNMSHNGNGKRNGRGNGNGKVSYDTAAMRSGDQHGEMGPNSENPNDLPIQTTDSQSGYRAMSLRALNNMDFYSEGYNIESDMFSHFIERGLNISEVPITVKYDIANSHKKNPISHGMDVLGHIIGLIGYRRPLLSFGIPGLTILLLGLIGASISIARYYQTSYFPFMLTVVSGLCLVLGMLFVNIALILNSLGLMVKEERAKAFKNSENV